MKGRHPILLHYNARNDNLGDQYIFKVLFYLARASGTVCLRSPISSDFLNLSPLVVNRRRAVADIVNSRLRGGRATQVLSPGARLRTNAISSRAQMQERATRFAYRFVGLRRVAVGLSVIPDSNHDWCRHLDWIGVRDQSSLDALHSVGISQASYFPDLSLLSKVERRDQQGTSASFSFRSHTPESPTNDYSGRLEEVIPLLTEACSKVALKPTFFHQVVEDFYFSRLLAIKSNAVEHLPRLDIHTFSHFYQQAQVVVSNRLHVLLLGALCGAVPVAVTSRTHTKLVSLFQTIGLPDLVLDIWDNSIAQNFHEVLTNIGDHRTNVDRVLNEQYALGCRCFVRYSDRTARSVVVAVCESH